MRARGGFAGAGGYRGPDIARRVLLVDDDPAVRDALGQTLELAGLEPIAAGSFVEAKDHIQPDFAGVVLSDIRMPGRDGFHLLDHVRGIDPDLPVVLLTGEGDIPMAVRAMSNGAFDFLEKPCAPSDLVATLQRALRARDLVMENRRLRRELEAGDPAARLIFGRSAKAERMRAQARVAAASGLPVLLTGPEGAGISKVAEVIHLTSSRAKGPLQKRAAHALDREMLAGLLSACAGGTLFLDGIDALPPDTQMALADALEGACGALVIGGANRPVEALSQVLHPELFYRLEVMQLHIPPLSERPEDIPVLFRHYVAQAAEQSGLPAPQIGPDLSAALMGREWPGNARALMSAAMRFVLGVGDPLETQSELSGRAALGLADRMAQVERALLIEALTRAHGQARTAAQALKLPRKTFYDKMARYGLKPEDYRRGG
jgi:two-component system C4-dicarboxylate transport response regulator DctD